MIIEMEVLQDRMLALDSVLGSPNNYWTEIDADGNERTHKFVETIYVSKPRREHSGDSICKVKLLVREVYPSAEYGGRLVYTSLVHILVVLYTVGLFPMQAGQLVRG